MSTRPLRVRVAFEIIVRHLSGKPFLTSRRDIYNNHVLPVYPGLDFESFSKACPLLKVLRFIEKRGNSDWYIKSVAEMCDRLWKLSGDPCIGVRELKHPISLAFGIIIHDFNGQTVSTTKIETRIRTKIESYEGELSQYQNENVVPFTLRFLNYFGFTDWHIKSVRDICKQLCDLIDNRNIGDEGEDF